MENNIKPNEINYLSFEGGGGKGVAYLSPLIAMLHPSFNIFKKENNARGYMVLNRDKIKGISGASAGAIIAALLASNVPLETIAKLVLNISPPKYGIKELIAKDNVMASFNDLSIDIKNKYAFVPNIANSKNFGFDLRKRIISKPAIIYAARLLYPYMISDLKDIENAAFEMYNNLKFDYGLVPGYILRKYISYMIGDGLGYQNSNNQGDIIYNRLFNITFKEHFEKTGIELVLTSVNLSLRQMFYLSYKTTPNLCVADAVRMSMSIPGFFKPIHILPEHLKDKKYTPLEKAILPGFWVDGGVVNNNPIHAFDVDEKEKRTEFYKFNKINPNLFGLRLGRERKIEISNYYVNQQIEKIHDTMDFLGATAGVLIDNSSELYFHDEYERARVLDITTSLDERTKLSVLDFSPKMETVIKIIKNGIEETMVYFDLDNKQNPKLHNVSLNIELQNQLGLSADLKKGLTLLA